MASIHWLFMKKTIRIVVFHLNKKYLIMLHMLVGEKTFYLCKIIKSKTLQVITLVCQNK